MSPLNHMYTSAYNYSNIIVITFKNIYSLYLVYGFIPHFLCGIKQSA